RIFVSRHSAHLKNLCQAVINIDSVGGRGEIFVEMEGGVENISPIKGSLSIPFHIVDKALHNRVLHSDILWMLPQLILASNVDESFKGTISKAAELAGFSIVPARYQGSDHLVFARAGVPATNFATSGGYTHSEEDNLANINAENMEKVMNIIIKLVELLDKE
ncbi:MAG: M28 family metallopeptidase, partial [Candidatus Aminicenantes bacterium]|nr:M28 family metallopeptidase [Candidatus Aminicenantes bacterium]